MLQLYNPHLILWLTFWYLTSFRDLQYFKQLLLHTFDNVICTILNLTSARNYVDTHFVSSISDFDTCFHLDRKKYTFKWNLMNYAPFLIVATHITSALPLVDLKYFYSIISHNSVNISTTTHFAPLFWIFLKVIFDICLYTKEQK